MMRVSFTKMHGAGNDFVVFESLLAPFDLRPDQLRFVADRHFGVGADQILVVEQATHPEADYKYRIFNQDGSEVEQCGNGSRCFMKYVHDRGLTQRNSIVVEVRKGLITLHRDPTNGDITVDMGVPILELADIPFLPEGLEINHVGKTVQYGIALKNSRTWVTPVSMGNPHAVQVVEDVDNYPVLEEGPQIECHGAFPQKVNAGFMQIINPSRIKLRVFERGAGETLSCGTGACAAVVTGVLMGRLTSPVQVETRGGQLSIAWQPGEPVFMRGPATTVFVGQIELPD